MNIAKLIIIIFWSLCLSSEAKCGVPAMFPTTDRAINYVGIMKKILAPSGFIISDNEKYCSRCKNVLPKQNFYPHKRMKDKLQTYCKKCSRQWHKERPEYVKIKNANFKAKYPDYHKNWQRENKYGVTLEQVLIIRQKQNGLCCGCLTPLITTKECVDHNHQTGKVRGLLCDRCNRTLGIINDSAVILKRLSEYIIFHTKKEAEEF